MPFFISDITIQIASTFLNPFLWTAIYQLPLILFDFLYTLSTLPLSLFHLSNIDMAEYGPTALPPGANDGGDGSSMKTATWVVGSDKNARSFVVKQGPAFVRCNLTDALDFNDMHYHVFDPPTGRRVKFVWKGPGRPQFQAFAHQYWEIQQEEEDSLARGDRLPGEDLSEGKYSANRESRALLT